MPKAHLAPAELDSPSGERAGAWRGQLLAAGTLVGEYRVTHKLGEGGFGTVFAAAHPVIGKRCAIKVLHAQFSENEAVVARFVAEARAVNQIRHRNIVDVFAFGELADGRKYYVMELLDGVALDAYLERAGTLPLPEALAVLHAIARALGAAHEAGILHRDLKPENVFFDCEDAEDIRPKLLDFGLAKLLAPDVQPQDNTRSGAPIGSPRYMSPEQCRGQSVDHRTDVYAFGCLAYRMLVGVAPFEASSTLDLLMSHVSLPPTPPSRRNAALGPHFDAPLLAMLEKLPERRPASPLAGYEALAQAAAMDGVSRPERLTASPDLSALLQETRSRDALLSSSTLQSASIAEVRVSSASGRSTWWWALTAGLALLLVGGLAVERSRARRAALAVVPTAASASRSAPEVSSAEPPAERVPAEFRLSGVPQNAEIYVDNLRLGLGAGPWLLTRSTEPRNLRIVANGYQVASQSFVLLQDTNLKVTLIPLKKHATNPRMSRDLEDPY